MAEEQKQEELLFVDQVLVSEIKHIESNLKEAFKGFDPKEVGMLMAPLTPYLLGFMRYAQILQTMDSLYQGTTSGPILTMGVGVQLLYKAYVMGKEDAIRATADPFHGMKTELAN